MDKVINWELCKKLKFDHASILKNETHKLLKDFQIQIDFKKNKKKKTENLTSYKLCSPGKVKLIESEKKDKYLDLARELKTLWNMKAVEIPTVISASWYSHQTIDTGTGRLGNQWTSGKHPNYSIKIGQNTGKSPGHLSRFAITQTPARKHESHGDSNCYWRTRFSQLRFGSGIGGFENKMTTGDPPN